MNKRKSASISDSSPLMQALSSFDAIQSSLSKASSKLDAKLSKQKKTTLSKSFGSGVGYGGTATTGFTKTAQKAMEKKRNDEIRVDSDMKQAFILLAGALPPDDSDELPKSKDVKSCLTIMLLLLRNDSLLNIGQRADVYQALFEALTNVARFDVTAALLITETLLTLLRALAQQAKMFQSINKHNGDDDDVCAALAMCLHVSDTLDECSRAVGVTSRSTATSRSIAQSSSTTTSSTATSSTPEEKYAAALSKYRCSTTNLLNLVETKRASHALLVNGKASTTIVGSAAARTKKISMEFSTLMSSLPVHFASSIFLKADEERLDVMKAMITGPEGTPYENGCFVFDIVLPPNYPTEPPKVLLETTGSRKVRFNPNLYAEGKVCLSLLGTWSGPGWDPKTSTLLQVLMSIQALIFVPDPYHNEPGLESKNGTNLAQSKQYNSQIRAATVQHSILPALKNVGNDYVFGAIIREHFARKKDAILKQLDDWEARLEEGVSKSTHLSNKYGTGGWVNLVCGGGVVPDSSTLSPVFAEARRLLTGDLGPEQKPGSQRSNDVICLDVSEQTVGLNGVRKGGKDDVICLDDSWEGDQNVDGIIVIDGEDDDDDNDMVKEAPASGNKSGASVSNAIEID